MYHSVLWSNGQIEKGAYKKKKKKKKKADAAAAAAQMGTITLPGNSGITKLAAKTPTLPSHPYM